MSIFVRTSTVTGTNGLAVTVEAHIATGLPGFTILGRPDDVCRESRERVRAALLSSGFHWPARRITINLSPSGTRKVGSALDLAMAIAILAADDQIEVAELDDIAFIGELGLDGSIRAVPGVAPMAAVHRERMVVVPPANAREADIVQPRRVEVASSLVDVVAAITRARPWPVRVAEPPVIDAPSTLDLADVRGQTAARLGLELSAAGGHHLLLVGPPGAGKTMLAQRLPGLLPELDADTALEVMMVRSAVGESIPVGGPTSMPPIRMPHHSASHVSMVGGGSANLRPGEVSLAHGGVLFLDELGEFAPSTLDALRQPLEEGVIRLSRASATAVLPARFTLVGATNPCPCGGGPPGSCECDETALARYRRRFSGPLVDRFDVRVVVHRPGPDELLGTGSSECTALVRERVLATRAIAIERQGMLNARLSGPMLDEFARPTAAATNLLRAELEAGRLSGRGLHRIRRVARTLADRDGIHGDVGDEHVALALSLRARIAARHR